MRARGARPCAIAAAGNFGTRDDHHDDHHATNTGGFMGPQTTTKRIATISRHVLAAPSVAASSAAAAPVESYQGKVVVVTGAGGGIGSVSSAAWSWHLHTAALTLIWLCFGAGRGPGFRASGMCTHYCTAYMCTLHTRARCRAASATHCPVPRYSLSCWLTVPAYVHAGCLSCSV
jgi:hypothetical protein